MAIRRWKDLYKGRFFQETVQRAHEHLIDRYADVAVDSMRTQLKQRDDALSGELQTVVDSLVEHRKVLSHLASLRTAGAWARGVWRSSPPPTVRPSPRSLSSLRPPDSSSFPQVIQGARGEGTPRAARPRRGCGRRERGIHARDVELAAEPLEEAAEEGAF